ncbi:MAG TPA: response regulator [Gemmatimonadales bacterium]|nr:response regulator [Gemmatimonadales bacterium]
MSSPSGADLIGHHQILVADEDPNVVAFIIQTLREDGHAVFHAYDGLSATELAFALDNVHLVISNTRVAGLPGIELVYRLRARLPNLPVLYLANIDRSTPAIESKLPRNVPILREPFTADELRAVVRRLLAGEPEGTELSSSSPR